MQFVDYMVTSAFGLSEIGEVRKAILIQEDPDTKIALIYHPKDEDGCSSYEFCKKIDGIYWVSVDDRSYVNCGD